MAVRMNRMYNDPALGAAFSNLAAAFGPPSGSDMAGYASANAKREEAARLAELFASGTTPSERAALTGVQGYGQTPQGFTYNVDQGNATQRYGYDTQASTSRANNAADNDRAMMEAILRQATDPVAQGAIRPGFDPSEYGVPGVSAVPEFAGRAAPLSETQWQAQQNERMLADGTLTDDMLIDTIMGQRTPVEAIGPDGTPVFMSPGGAVRQGATPAPRGAEGARKDAIAVINGQQVPITRAPNGLEWQTADGTPIPPDAPVFHLPQVTGSAEETGLTTSVTSGVQSKLIATQQTIDTASTLRDMIRSNPSSQGIVGSLRGTAQDVVQTGGELGQLFGGGLADVNNSIRQGLADAGIRAEFFDPSIPAIDMMTNLLAWQYAKSMAGDRVSNEQLRAAQQAIGGRGLFANQANSVARLDELIRSLETQQGQLQSLQPGFAIGGNAPRAPTPPSPPIPIGTVEDGYRFIGGDPANPASWEPM